MATTGTLTVRDVVTRALRKAGICGIGDDPTADDAQTAMEELDMMLKSWQNEGYNLWTKTSMSHTLTTSAAQTLDPVRPMRILSCRYKSSAAATELVMTRMMRDEYDSLPNKTTTGTPTQFYYDRQRESARLYVWPLLTAATGQTLQITYDRELEDITSLDDTLDMPSEWFLAVVYGLAALMMETVPVRSQDQRVTQRAQMLLNKAGAFDQEQSVFFAGEYSE
jgi:hypothetical protein